MKVKNQLASSSHHWGSNNQKTSITIHETANRNRGAGAQAHANLQSNGNVRQASWHIQVDDIEAIRSFVDDMRVWHAGRAAQDSLALEICVNSDSDYDKALANAAEVVKQWREKYNIGRDGVVDHHHWTGKNCPTILRARGSKAWSNFVAATDPGSSSTPSSGSGGGSSRKTTAQLAREVIDGKHGTGDARKRALGGRYSEVQREVNRILGGASSKPSKSAQQVAQDIANGRGGWGNDPERSRKLRAAGYDAADVQRRVNALLSNRGSSKTTAQLAQEVIDGKHGSGDARKRSLGSRYSAVQAEVNRRLGGGRGKSIGTLAREVIDGKWGNEPQRSQRLRREGYNAAAVQREVNRRLR